MKSKRPSKHRARRASEDSVSRSSINTGSTPSSHSIYKPKKKITFDEDCIEPTDREFLFEFSKRTKFSWFSLMFIMACLPTYCKDLVRIGTTASEDMEITCLIPNLIRKMDWNLTSIKNLTMPVRGTVCTYFDYNYSVFENMKPEEAFAERDRLKIPIVKKCTIKIDGKDHYFANYTRTILKSCSGFNFKNEAKHYRDLFESISYIICGTLGDIFGRKIVLIVSSIIFTVGIVVTPLATSYYSLVVGYSIEAIGVAGMLILNYIIFVELCNANFRGLLMLYLTLFGAIAKITGYSLKPQVFKFHETYYLFTIPSCSILLYLYLIPESPRWLLSYGKKKRAWKILANWGEDLSQYVFLPEVKLNKFKVLLENYDVLFRVKKYRKIIFLMIWFQLVKILIISSLRRYVKILNNNATSHKFLILMAEIFSYFSVLPPFILFGRYVTLFWMFVSGGLCLIISLFIQTNEGWYMLNILSAQYFYALEYVLILYSAELLPTSARGTGLGLILGISEGLAVFVKTIMQAWILKKVMGYFESYIMVSLQMISIFLVGLVPNVKIGELPDWKRYKNFVHN